MVASVSRRVLLRLAASRPFERLVRALPLVEPVAYRRARRYVAGPVAGDALACARELHAQAVAASIDLVGGSVGDARQAEAVTAAYIDLTGRLDEAPHGTYLSIDLSRIGLDGSPSACRARMERIAGSLPAGSAIQVNAEEARRAQAICDTVLALAGDGLSIWATVQANLRRSPRDAERLAAGGVPVRLVKGAYLEDPEEALPWGEPTDRAYRELARTLHAGGVTLALATHDGRLRDELLSALPGSRIEMLLGVRPQEARELAGRGMSVRVYVPYGPGWFRYAMRRLAESRGG
jgi:proline dehydrogenase